MGSVCNRVYDEIYRSTWCHPSEMTGREALRYIVGATLIDARRRPTRGFLVSSSGPELVP
jgi:hypothetical protein